MWEKYKETFDGVHASQRLKTEVLNMKREENGMRRRRVPAALAAAVLVAALLAGTTAAYLSRVTVAPYEEGYSVQSETGNIPLASLSEDMQRRSALSADGTEILPFDSWDEAETYLGLEIADNIRLNQMTAGLCGASLGGSRETILSPSLIWLYYDSSGSLESIILQSGYLEDGFRVDEEARLLVENQTLGERPQWYGFPASELTGTEIYVTPHGIETTIIIADQSAYVNGRTTYAAQFVLNQAFFRVEISTNANRGESGEDALSLLKEILDAYE